MIRYDAVLFDWMLTLADYPDEREHLRQAHDALGREVDARVLDEMVDRLLVAAEDTDVRAAMSDADISVDHHRDATMLHWQRASVDADLAGAMYGLLGDPTFHPLYRESARVLHGLAERGVPIAVISDIHADLRTHATQFGIDHVVDAWVLSFEHGIQKPDPAIFQLALEELGVSPERALMVGDRASHDGGAAALGIDTVILPNRSSTTAERPDRLDIVLGMVGM